MKKVEFVRVKSELSGYGFGKGMKYCFTGIENIIKDRLMDGCSFSVGAAVSGRRSDSSVFFSGSLGCGSTAVLWSA